MARPRSTDTVDNVSALQRGFDVLECVAASPVPLGNAEVSALTGIPRPTVSRLMATLVSMGHLRLSIDGERYELASGLVRLAQAFLGAIDVRAWARPHLSALAEATGVSALLGVRDGNEMLVVEAMRSRSAVAVFRADVGTRMALPTSALGRAWLAGIDATAREALIAGWRKGASLGRDAGVRARGRTTTPDVDQAWAEPAMPPVATDALAAMQAELTRVPEQGFALSIGEWHPGINAVAVPVRTPGGEVVAINCGGPAFVLDVERIHGFVLPKLLAAAEAIGRDIGGTAGRALTLSTASQDMIDDPAIKAGSMPRRKTPSTPAKAPSKKRAAHSIGDKT